MEPGYVSTHFQSFNKEQWINLYGRVLWIISLPKGTPALTFPRQPDTEFELLLPRNSFFLVERVEECTLPGRSLIKGYVFYVQWLENQAKAKAQLPHRHWDLYIKEH
jgi:hypothetical protein